MSLRIGTSGLLQEAARAEFITSKTTPLSFLCMLRDYPHNQELGRCTIDWQAPEKGPGTAETIAQV